MKSSLKKYKVIGEGSYGCVVKPSIPCNENDKVIVNKKKSKELVSKVFEEKKNYKKELELSKKAATIDNIGNNLLLPTKGCSIKNEDLARIEDKCDFDFENADNYYQLVMPYGGQEVKKYLQTHKSSCKEFLQFSTSLFKGLLLLKNKNYCHQDIKVNNVLITPQKKMIIIDYSLMKPFKDIYKEKNNRRLSKDYFLHPPEYKLVYYFNDDVEMFVNEVINNLRNLIKKLSNRHDYLDYYSEEEIMTNLNVMYNKYHKLAKNQDEIRKIMTKYADKMDIYSTGVLFMISRELLKTKCNNKDYINFIRKMIEFDPEYRISCNDAITECEKLLNK